MKDKSSINGKELERVLLLYLLKQIDNLCTEADIPYYASGGTCLGTIRHQGFIPWDDDIDLMIPRKYYDQFVEICDKKLKQPVLMRTRENDPWFCGEYIKICFKDDVKEYSDLSIDVFFLDETNPKRTIFRACQNFALISLYFIKLYKISKDGHGGDYTPHNPIKEILLKIASVIPYKTIDSMHKRIMLAEKKECSFFVNWGSTYSYKKSTYSKSALGTPIKRKFENTFIPTAEHPEVILKQLYGENYMTPPPPEKRIAHGYCEIQCSDLNLDKILEEIS